MDFKKLDFEKLIEQTEADEAEELARKFKDAHEQNLSEFQTADEEIEALEGRVSEFKDAALGDFSNEEELTEAVVEAGPLGEDELAGFSVARKQDLLADFSEAEDEPEDDAGEDEDVDFSDMGSRGETHTEDDGSEFAEQYLGDVPGLVTQ